MVNDIPIRIMQFEFDANELRKSIRGMYGPLGLSMTLPYLEPYLIRSMREALKHTSDPLVEAEVRQFIGQEAQHFRQHRLLNDLLRNCHDGYADIRLIEDEMEADYQRFTATKSLKFNLAYAEGFEAATCALACNSMKYMNTDAEMSDIKKLFVWHLTEEIEHRTVTFNIYKHLFGGYFYRLFVGIYGQYHFFKYVYRFARFIAQNEPIADKDQAGGKSKSTKNSSRRSLKVVFALLGSLLGTYLPWYDPANVELPDNIEGLSEKFSVEALETRGVS